MTCDYATWDGSYVLGALAPAEREHYERHLAGCPACAEAVRALAGLPGLLSRVDEHALAEPLEPAPGTLLPRLVREVRRERRRRGVLAAGLTAAAVAVVAGAVAVGSLTGAESPTAAPPGAGSPSAVVSPDGTATEATGRAMQPVGGAPVEGWLTLEPVPWGTRLTLQCTYRPGTGGYGGPDPLGYVMVVRTRDGAEQQVATWKAVPGRSMQLAAATAAGRGDIATVEVRTDDGRPVLRLRS